jgi:hypothetical protein
MEAMSDKELFGLLRQINKTRESHQGEADASLELLFEFATGLVERRTREAITDQRSSGTDVSQNVQRNQSTSSSTVSFEVYRHEPDSFSRIACVDSVKKARTIVHSSATNPLDEFLIYDAHTKEGVILRADGYWFPPTVSSWAHLRSGPYPFR